MIQALRAQLLVLRYDRWLWARIAAIGLVIAGAVHVSIDPAATLVPALHDVGIFLLLALGGALPALLDPPPIGPDGDTRSQVAMPALPVTLGQRAMSTVVLSYPLLVVAHLGRAWLLDAEGRSQAYLETLLLLVASLPLLVLTATQRLNHVLPALGLLTLTAFATHHGAGRLWAPTLGYVLVATPFVALRPYELPGIVRTVGYAGSGLAGIIARGAFRAVLGLTGVVVVFWAAVRFGDPDPPEPELLLLLVGWFGLLWPAIPSAQRTGVATDMDIGALLRLPVRRTRVVGLLALAGMLRPLPALAVLALLLGEPPSFGDALAPVLWACGLGALGGVYTALPIRLRLWVVIPTMLIAVPAALVGAFARTSAPAPLFGVSLLAIVLLTGVAAWATRRALASPILWT